MVSPQAKDIATMLCDICRLKVKHKLMLRTSFCGGLEAKTGSPLLAGRIGRNQEDKDLSELLE